MDDPTSPAADLAEQLVDEIARPHQDWRLIHGLAAELEQLAAAVVEAASGDQATDPPSGP